MSDSAIQFILPLQIWKMTQRHQIMWGCEICIRSGTYQESPNNSSKRQLRYIKNSVNLLRRVSVEQLNTDNIVSWYSDAVLTDGESIHPRAKDTAFFSMCDIPEKDTKLPK